MYGDHDHAGGRRAAAAAATLAIHGVLAAGLLWGLSVGGSGPDDAPEMRAVTFSVRPPPPPPPPPPQASSPSAAKESAGAAGAPGEALPSEAPEAAVPLVTAPAAVVAAEGRDASAGAASRGDGAGAAAGTGTGGGGEGVGGDGGGIGSPARRIAGALRDSDYPREAEATGLAGTVVIGFRVRTDGRADRCAIVRSSGHAMLDDLTCRLFTQRYRFRPATTATGKVTESTLQTSFTWGTRRR